MDGAKISPKTLDGENDIDTLCLKAVHALMKNGASHKKLSPSDIRTQKRTKLNVVSNEAKISNLENGSVENARDVRALRRAKLNHVSNETKLSNLEDPFKMGWHHHYKSHSTLRASAQKCIQCTLFQRQSRRTLWKLGQINKMSLTSKIWSG